MSSKPEPRELPDDAELTQYGEKEDPDDRPVFHNKTRPERGEIDMSLIFGRVDAITASMMVRRIVVPNAIVRHTTASALRSKGFTVEHTPRKKNDRHVSVLPPKASDEFMEWDNDMAVLFDSCFTD